MTDPSVGDATGAAGHGDRRELGVVWLTTNYPSQDDVVTGIFHRTAARALVRSGIGVTVISPTPAAPWPAGRLRERWRRYAAAPRRERDEGVDVIRPRYLAVPGDPSWSRSDALMARAAMPLLRAHGSVDLMHAHFAAPMGLVAWRLARATRIPYVITMHGSEEVWRLAHPARLSAYRAALRGASLVLTVSKELVDEARDVAGVRAVQMPIGIDLERFTQNLVTKDAARDRLGIAHDRVVLLLVATLLPAKGVRPLVDAVVGLGSPFLAILVGEGPEAGYRAADPAARGLVEYRGVVDNSGVATYMAAADAFVLPSDTEGLPTVLVEAGAARLPVIATRVGGVPDLLAGDRGVLLPDPSPASIAAAAAELARSPEQGADRAERLRRHVFEHYDSTTNARRLADLYRGSVAPAERPA